MKYQVNNNMDFFEVCCLFEMLKKRLEEEEKANVEQMERMKHGR
jgi:hypothetical protein